MDRLRAATDQVPQHPSLHKEATMPGSTGPTPLTPLPAIDYYDILYADAIVQLSDALTKDETKPWSLVNADGPSSHYFLTVMARRITLLKERYFELKRTSQHLLFIAQVWMHDASKHTQKQLEEEQQKYKKLRADRHVPDLEARTLERLKDLRHATNNAVEEYNNQWKWPDNSRPSLSLLGSLSKLEATVHEQRTADQSHQSNGVADVTLQGSFTASEEVRGSTDTAPDQFGQSNAVADLKLQDPPSDEVRDSTDAVSDQYGQSDVADVNFQGYFTASEEVRSSIDAAFDQHGQTNAVADVKLQGPPNDEVRDSTVAASDQYGQADDVANVKLQGPPNDGVRDSADAASDQYDQSHAVADVNFQDSTENGEVRGSTDAVMDQPDEPDAVADVALQDTAEPGEVRVPADADLDQSDQPYATADVNLQDTFTENDEVRGSNQGDESTLSGVCYASLYAASVQALSAMLQELDQHRDSINKEFIESDDPVRAQVIQVLKGASSHVSTVAKKWMGKAVTEPVRYRTESQVLQTMRKDLHVLSLQRRVSSRLQELRNARRVIGQTSTDQNNDQYVVPCKTPRADEATCAQGFETTVRSAGYVERLPQTSKLYQLLEELKHLRSLQTPAKALLFQQPVEKAITQPTSQRPEGFQAHSEIANHEWSKNSVSKEEITQASSPQAQGFQAQPEIANREGSETGVSKEQVTSLRPEGFQAHPEIANQEGSENRASQDRHLSSLATVVENFEEPSSDQGSEAVEQASHAYASEIEFDFNEPSSDSGASEQDTDTAKPASHADEFEIEFEDFNEPPSDSASDQCSDEADEFDKFDKFNEPFSDSEDPEQTSDDADQFDEPSPEQASDDANEFDEQPSDTEDPEGNSDADE